jgi:EpsI family protein
LLVNALLVLTLAASWAGRRSESAVLPQPDFFRGVTLAYREWKTTELTLTKDELTLLEPDALIIRRYTSPEGRELELAVIAGHKKRTVHTPAFCMPSDGWDILAQHEVRLPVGGRTVPAMQALMQKDRQRLLTTFLFTDGEFATANLIRFQGEQLVHRLKGQVPLGALVRVLAPVGTSEAETRRLVDDFVGATLPDVMRGLRRGRGLSR